MTLNRSLILPTLATIALAAAVGLGATAAERAPASLQAAPPDAGAGAAPLRLPWRQAGLSEREAAAHLLDRLTYGPRPGEVERVVAMGLESWLAGQLAADLPEPELTARLARFDALGMSFEGLAATYPPPGLFLLEARRAGVLPADVDPRALGDLPEEERQQILGDLFRFAAERGVRRQRDLLAQLTGQKLVRAVYAENQLAELLTDFWFNHFNVSTTDNEARVAVVAYERDAVRPHALGRFGDLLVATAKHPAMLLYLDNARSVAAAGAPTTASGRLERLRGRRAPGRIGRPGFGGRGSGPERRRPPAASAAGSDAEIEALRARNRPTGLNENYARELLELHTLGVDGGYTQEDVVEVARAFTGWTVFPPRALSTGNEERLARLERFGDRLGFVREGAFLFRADAHDAGAKSVLGVELPAGRGLEDGEAVLALLAGHPATARHLAAKLAARFVADEPPAELVERLAASFAAGGGEIRPVLRALVESPEFWAPAARRAKIKSPLELAASALRGLGAELRSPRGTVDWIARMGQPLYAYQAPTGYPDRAEAWVDAGSLLNRMNFGLQLAAGRVAGAEVDLTGLIGEAREPESREAALAAYAALLLPGRDLAETLRRLEPMAARADLAGRIDEEAPGGSEAAMAGDETDLFGDGAAPGAAGAAPAPAGEPPPAALAQVGGGILGSPEYQRR